MRVLLLATCVFVCLLGLVHCQEDSGSDDGFLSRVMSTLRNFAQQVKDIFGELRKEITARAADVRIWTTETWNSFKDSMKQMVGQRTDLTDSQKWEAENFIENLEMPKNNEVTDQKKDQKKDP